MMSGGEGSVVDVVRLSYFDMSGRSVADVRGFGQFSVMRRSVINMSQRFVVNVGGDSWGIINMMRFSNFDMSGRSIVNMVRFSNFNMMSQRSIVNMVSGDGGIINMMSGDWSVVNMMRFSNFDMLSQRSVVNMMGFGNFNMMSHRSVVNMVGGDWGVINMMGFREFNMMSGGGDGSMVILNNRGMVSFNSLISSLASLKSSSNSSFQIIMNNWSMMNFNWSLMVNNWRSISLHNFSHLMTLDWDFFMMMVVMMIMMIMMVVMMKVVLMDMFNRSSDLKGMTFSDSVMMRSDSVSKSNKIRSEMRINNEHILNQVISELRVLRSHPVKSFLDHSLIHGSMLIVIAFFRVEESSQSKESCSQREHISLVFVTLDLEVRVGDLLKPFRSNEGLETLDDGKSKSI
jgi:mRNA-degrading endonuclease HigB of HigAB toxin-antitoxin module